MNQSTTALPAVQRHLLEQFRAGGKPNQIELMRDGSNTQQAWNIYQTELMLSGEQGKLYGPGKAALQERIKDAQRRQYQASKELGQLVRELHPDAAPVRQQDATGLVASAFNQYETGEFNTATSAANSLFPQATAAALLRRTGQRKKMKKAVAACRDMPGAVAYREKAGARAVGKLAHDSGSATFGAVSDAMRLTLAINQADSKAEKALTRVSELESRIAALEAQAATQAQRNAVDDAGQDPKELARSMRSSGASLSEIAKATGRSRSTIQRWI